MTGSEQTDEHLMLAFSRGDTDAFSELFARYKQPLFGFFRRRVADQALAEELTQDTFVAVLRASERYEPTALFRTYLYAAALAECKGLGRVENETQSGEEVTQQHADLLARLQNARETEARFRAILAQRTGKVSDVLEVEESIARVRGEIEQMEAEQQTLEHRVDFATVDIQLTEQYKASLDAPADSTATRLHNAFVAGYRNASDTIVGIILFFAEYGPAILIWLAILGTPAWLVWRHRRRA